MSSAEQLARRLIEDGFDKGDLSVADDVISPDQVEHQYYGPDHAPGAEGVKAVISSLRRAFSDFHLAIDDLVVDGDKVWLRMTGTGTNDGSFMGHPPTGRRMHTMSSTSFASRAVASSSTGACRTASPPCSSSGSRSRLAPPPQARRPAPQRRMKWLGPAEAIASATGLTWMSAGRLEERLETPPASEV